MLIGCGGSTEKVAPKSQADSKATGFDEMEKLSEKVESLNETERAELAFNRFNNLKSVVDKATVIANQEPPKETPNKLITDPIVEAAIRKSLNKPNGELTKADLEKVFWLELDKLTNLKGLEKLTLLERLGLDGNQLTDVKGLEKLTKLKEMYLEDNPDLTKAQIAELEKALPNCTIYSNPTKQPPNASAAATPLTPALVWVWSVA